MIDLYYWTTPNGHKVSILLEETGLPYKIHPVNITKNEQFTPEFLKINPNNKIPAIKDKDIAIFESGAVLMYLARKAGKFLGDETKTLPWLFWQVGGLGPMMGQAMHFNVFAKEKIPYAINRYKEEVERLFKVADTELKTHKYLGGDEYTIADIAAYPWIVPHEKLGLSLSNYPSLKAWSDAIAQRPAVITAYKKAKEINPDA